LIDEIVTEKVGVGILIFEVALEEQIALLNLILIQYSFETKSLESVVNAVIHGSIHYSLLDSSTLKKIEQRSQLS